jgi:biopolymer transport protein ExbD
MRAPLILVLSRLLSLACGLLVVCACGTDKPKQNPFETKKDTVEPPKLVAPPKPEGPPEFVVAAEGPKVAWTYVMLEKPDGKQKLRSEIGEHAKYVSGKEVALKADRPAKLAHVSEMMQALFEAGATSIAVSTDTRTEFPKTVTFSPRPATPPAPCSVVAKVLTERRIAVWTLKGGTAVKSPKGLAGPDLSMAGESIENTANRCKGSDVVIVSADEDVEWGLTYDLSAATQKLEKARLGKVVLMVPAPVAGRPVKLD